MDRGCLPAAAQVRLIDLHDQAGQKLRYLRELGVAASVAVGNGENDRLMLEAAALGVAVLGPEGASARTLAAADVVVREITEGLDLLLRPKRLIATLRR